jgi:hypothetical protein
MGVGLLLPLRDRGQTPYLLSDLAASADQIQDQSVVHIERSLVFSPIPHVVALRQHSPDLGAKIEGVGKHLKDNVPLRGTESVMAKRSETESVSRTVG